MHCLHCARQSSKVHLKVIFDACFCLYSLSFPIMVCLCHFLSCFFPPHMSVFSISYSLHRRKPAGHHHCSQKVIEDETAGAAVHKPSSDRPGSSRYHVPSGCGLCLEPSLAWRTYYLRILWPGGVLLRCCQHHEPDHLGPGALLCVPQSAIST